MNADNFSSQTEQIEALKSALFAYEAVFDGIVAMLTQKRLTKADIPEDYHWLIRAVRKCRELDP